MDNVGSPLTVAVKHSQLEKIKLHLGKGANPTQIDETGISPLYRAIRDSKLEPLKLFLEGIDIKNVRNEDYNTPLIAAVKSNSSLEIIESLLQSGVDINKSTIRTPLAWAAAKGHLNVAKFLVEKGADLNLISYDGNTPVGAAARFDKLEVAKYLVSQHADLDKFRKDNENEGKSPMHWAVLNENLGMVGLLLEHGATLCNYLFFDAIEIKNVKLVELMIEKGASVSRSEDPTPLQIALDMEHYEIASLLIAHGARVVEDLQYQEVARIWELVETNNLPMVRLLAENGARLNEQMSAGGETLLTRCILEEKFDWVQYFINVGADVNEPNREGLTPLAIADSNCDFQMMQLLVEYGAVATTQEMRDNLKLERYFDLAKDVLKKCKPS